MSRGYYRSRSRSQDRDRRRHRHHYEYSHRRSRSRYRSPPRRHRYRSRERHRDSRSRDRDRYHRDYRSGASWSRRSHGRRSRSVSMGYSDAGTPPPEPSSSGSIPPLPRTPPLDRSMYPKSEHWERDRGHRDGRNLGPRRFDPLTPSPPHSEKTDHRGHPPRKSPKAEMSPLSNSSATSDKAEVKTHWKGFPVPKLYKGYKRFFNATPKKDDTHPPSMYFPVDGTKVRRHKTMKFHCETKSRCLDDKAFINDLKNLFIADYNLFKVDMELLEIGIECAALSVPYNVENSSLTNV